MRRPKITAHLEPVEVAIERVEVLLDLLRAARCLVQSEKTTGVDDATYATDLARATRLKERYDSEMTHFREVTVPVIKQRVADLLVGPPPPEPDLPEPDRKCLKHNEPSIGLNLKRERICLLCLGEGAGARK